MSMLTNISPQFVPIVALLVPIVGVIAWAAVKITQMILLHETVRQLSANGQPVPPELLAKMTGEKRSA